MRAVHVEGRFVLSDLPELTVDHGIVAVSIDPDHKFVRNSLLRNAHASASQALFLAVMNRLSLPEQKKTLVVSGANQ
jgi:hypothetical protein